MGGFAGNGHDVIKSAQRVEIFHEPTLPRGRGDVRPPPRNRVVAHADPACRRPPGEVCQPADPVVLEDFGDE